MKYPTRYKSILDLAELPWFDLKNGDLIVDDNVGPSIDVHTHLALTFLMPQRLDLNKLWPKTEHYLPLSSELDLEVYVNKNFTTATLEAMRKDLTLGSLGTRGMRRTHTLPNLAREMADLGVVGSVLLAIDWPKGSDNAGTWLKVSRDKREFVVFGSVHPYRPGIARELDRQVALGACGIKVHPAVQLTHPSSHRALKLYRECAKRHLPVLFHCGPVDIEPPLGRYLSQVRHYEKGIAKNPDTTFVLGHAGALQIDQALEIARRHQNVWVEISSQALGNIRRIVETVPAERILFGSDWPFYHQAIPLAKVLIATEGQEDLRKKILFENAVRLLGLSPDRFLKKAS